MSLEGAIAVYLVIWWTALFAILPLGVRSHLE
jgi:predicted secreted protein